MAGPESGGVEALDLFAGLDAATRARLLGEFETLALQRGAHLIRHGDVAEHLYIVVSGRFAVTLAGRPAPLNEIGPGQAVGEIAFFAGGRRTADVIAQRDSLVLRLARADYERLAAQLPSVQSSVTRMLAQRLADTTAGRKAVPDPRPRTIAVVPVGRRAPSSAFMPAFEHALRQVARVRVLDATEAARDLPAMAGYDSPAATEALNTLERAYDYVVFLTDPDLSPWSLKSLRQADLVLLVGDHDACCERSALEADAAERVGAAQTRLVLLHPTRTAISGTARWLEGRAVAMHHHVALDRPDDTARLVRFIHGTARGLVAGGGGAFCIAHAGVYKALLEAGHTFDMMGGTSGGSAMTAAFAVGVAPDDIDASVEETFVRRRAMRRYTVPRYGLIDHTRYDSELAALFGDRRIEDLWLPFFCVSTNLSDNRLHQHRQGLVWQAVRASSSIPVLLPPFYTADGDMLVDGGLIDNVPIKVMHALKSGPNVVLSLEAPKLARFAVDYDALPSRNAMLRTLANPFSRQRLPPAPGIGTVLLRALVAHRQDYERQLGEDDLHLKPPLPSDMSLLDWHRHGELFESAYRWGRAQLSEISRKG